MELINRMKSGDKDAIRSALYHRGAFIRVNGITYAARLRYADPMVKQRIRELAKDETFLFGKNAGPTVSDFARAYLDVLNIERYLGEREETKKLIQIKLRY